MAEAESAFDADTLWPAHPIDEADGPLPSVASLYLGASGVIWAFHELEHAGFADLQRDWAPVAVRLAERYPGHPDFQDLVSGPVPSLLMGEAGILLVAHTIAPAPRGRKTGCWRQCRQTPATPPTSSCGERPER